MQNVMLHVHVCVCVCVCVCVSVLFVCLCLFFNNRHLVKANNFIFSLLSACNSLIH